MELLEDGLSLSFFFLALNCFNTTLGSYRCIPVFFYLLAILFSVIAFSYAT